jgi:heme oxygenase
MLRAWLAPLQAWLAGFSNGPQFDQAARLALIDQDLAEQGMPAAPPAQPARLAAAASPAWRWGVCYVIEGSQLGGAVLYQRLHARLAPHPLRYLKGIDAGPGPRWRAFMQALREHVRSPEEIAEASAGACAAFDSILALGSCTGTSRTMHLYREFRRILFLPVTSPACGPATRCRTARRCATACCRITASTSCGRTARRSASWPG